LRLVSRLTRRKLAISRNAWLFASFDGEFSDRSQSYAGKAGGRIVWYRKTNL
jgi:hypothetical protein